MILAAQACRSLFPNAHDQDPELLAQQGRLRRRIARGIDAATGRGRHQGGVREAVQCLRHSWWRGRLPARRDAAESGADEVLGRFPHETALPRLFREEFERVGQPSQRFNHDIPLDLTLVVVLDSRVQIGIRNREARGDPAALAPELS